MRAPVRIAIVLLVAVVGAGCAPSGEPPASSPRRDLMRRPPSIALVAEDVTVGFHGHSYEWADVADDGTLTGMVQSMEPAVAAGPCTPDTTVVSGTTFALDIGGRAPPDLSSGASRQDASEQGHGLEMTDDTVVLDLEPGVWQLSARGRWDPEGWAAYRACITVVASDDREEDIVGGPPLPGSASTVSTSP